MSARDVFERYGVEINAHDFDRLLPLLARDCTFYFSSGTHRGLVEARAAFERTWRLIADEVYSVTEVQWVADGETSAACTYVFHWSGVVGGEPREGGGRGTSVFALRDGSWRIVHEHLSGFPAKE